MSSCQKCRNGNILTLQCLVKILKLIMIFFVLYSQNVFLDTPWRQHGNSGITSKLEGNKSENIEKSDLVAYNC